MPFPFYRKLNRRQQAVYRKSDSLTEIALAHPDRFGPAAEALRRALAADDRPEVGRAARALVSELVRALGAPPVGVRVLARRPSDAESELHGLYVRVEGRRPVITVWMRTAAHQRVVAYRTFLRTLLHEVCHHLDFDLFELEDSFHTEGFFKRESSLVRQIAGERTRRSDPGAKAAAGKAAGPEQLTLSLGTGAARRRSG